MMMEGIRKMLQSLRTKDEVAEVQAASDLSKPHLYYRKAPAWVPDSKASRCLSCRRHFDFLRRKHHCRRCGQIFCQECSNERFPLRRMGFTGDVRQCRKCLVISRAEFKFTKDYMTTLEKGAPFIVCAPGDSSCFTAAADSDVVLRVFIPPTHGSIEFAEHSQKREPAGRMNRRKSLPKPIDITSIVNIDRTSVPQLEPGTGEHIQGPALRIRHYNDQKRLEEILLVAAQDPPLFEEEKHWVIALNEACGFVRDHILQKSVYYH